jgi:hypothetical protein
MPNIARKPPGASAARRRFPGFPDISGGAVSTLLRTQKPCQQVFAVFSLFFQKKAKKNRA